MAVGKSGTLLASVPPDLKEKFYKALSENGKNFRSWLLDEMEKFVKANDKRKRRQK